MNTEVDYLAVLKDLEDKKAKIESAIQSIKDILGQKQIIEQANIDTSSSAQISSHAYFQMSMPDAIRKYLQTVKKPQTVKAIADALEAGGLTHAAKDFHNNVRSVLRRLAKDPNDIVKIKKEWGLAEWFPGRRKTKTIQEQSGTPENTEKENGD